MTNGSEDSGRPGLDAVVGWAYCFGSLLCYTVWFEVPWIRATAFSGGFITTCLMAGVALLGWLRDGDRWSRIASLFSVPLLAGWGWALYRFVYDEPPFLS